MTTANLKINLTGTESAAKAVERLAQDFNKVETEARGASSALDKVEREIKDVDKASSRTSSSFTKLGNSFGAIAKKGEGLIDSIGKLSPSLGSAVGPIKNLVGGMGNLSIATGALAGPLAAVAAVLAALAGGFFLAASNGGPMQKEFERIATSAKDFWEVLKAVTAQIADFFFESKAGLAVIGAVSDAFDFWKEKLEGTLNETNKAQVAQNIHNRTIEEAKPRVEKLAKSLEELATKTMIATNAMFAINSIIVEFAKPEQQLGLLTTQFDDLAMVTGIARQEGESYVSLLTRITQEIAKLEAEQNNSQGAKNHTVAIANLKEQVRVAREGYAEEERLKDEAARKRKERAANAKTQAEKDAEEAKRIAELQLGYAYQIQDLGVEAIKDLEAKKARQQELFDMETQRFNLQITAGDYVSVQSQIETLLLQARIDKNEELIASLERLKELQKEIKDTEEEQQDAREAAHDKFAASLKKRYKKIQAAHEKEQKEEKKREEANAKEVKKKQKEFVDMQKAGWDMVKSAAVDATVNGLMAFSSALGESLGGGEKFKDAWKGILGSLLQGLGATFASIGTAVILADPWSGGAPNPVKGGAMIGAGLAMTALGSSFGVPKKEKEKTRAPSTNSQANVSNTYSIVNEFGITADPKGTARAFGNVLEDTRRYGTA